MLIWCAARVCFFSAIVPCVESESNAVLLLKDWNVALAHATADFHFHLLLEALQDLLIEKTSTPGLLEIPKLTKQMLAGLLIALETDPVRLIALHV